MVILTPSEAAAWCGGVSVSTFNAKVRPELRAIRIGRRHRFRLDELALWAATFTERERAKREAASAAHEAARRRRGLSPGPTFPAVASSLRAAAWSHTQKPPDTTPLLSCAEAAELCGLPPAAFHHVRCDLYNVVQIGRAVRVRRQDLEEWAETFPERMAAMRIPLHLSTESGRT